MAARAVRHIAPPLPAAGQDQEYCPECDLRQVPGKEDHMPKCPRGGVRRIRPGYRTKPGSLAERMMDFLEKNGTTPSGMLAGFHDAEVKHVLQELRRLERRGLVESPGPEMWRMAGKCQPEDEIKSKARSHFKEGSLIRCLVENLEEYGPATLHQLAAANRIHPARANQVLGLLMRKGIAESPRPHVWQLTTQGRETDDGI